MKVAQQSALVSLFPGLRTKRSPNELETQIITIKLQFVQCKSKKMRKKCDQEHLHRTYEQRTYLR